MTATEASLRGRMGAYTLHATHDSNQTSAPGRARFLDNFLIKVDPDGVLSESERRRRAEFALKAHMANLALKSAQARRNKGGQGK